MWIPCGQLVKTNQNSHFYCILKNIGQKWAENGDLGYKIGFPNFISKIEKLLHFCCIDASKPISCMELPCGGLQKSDAWILKILTFCSKNTSLVVKMLIFGHFSPQARYYWGKKSKFWKFPHHFFGAHPREATYQKLAC